ncbi:MAG: L-malate glycosyltransferase [Thermosediminibacterales bacterium]|nr:L-malate glycosyltransferase [Thermosediminibacterales bacterium]
MQCIDQILPTITYGDAVSNDTIAIMKILREMGFESDIYAENIGTKVKKIARHISEFKIKSSNHVIIYHMSTGTKLSFMMRDLKNIKKVMMYHNITPAKYFKFYNSQIYQLVKQGREQLKMLSNSFDYAIADSEYNRKELIKYGYKNTHVVPILIPFDDYKKEADDYTMERYNDEKTNIIFVGRISPNKKQEDVIKSFYYYKKYINSNSRLFLIGSYEGMETYYNLLKKLVSKLGLKDVYFTGHISFSKLLAYYKIADVFLCMSEHEGFCVPLIESMFFKVPIIAYKSSAIPYTLGDAGIMVNKKDYYLIAEMIEQVVRDEKFRSQIIKKQNERLKDFSYENVKKIFCNKIKQIIG